MVKEIDCVGASNEGKDELTPYAGETTGEVPDAVE
jgi:hypothetical protein